LATPAPPRAAALELAPAQAVNTDGMTAATLLVVVSVLAVTTVSTAVFNTVPVVSALATATGVLVGATEGVVATALEWALLLASASMGTTEALVLTTGATGLAGSSVLAGAPVLVKGAAPVLGGVPFLVEATSAAVMNILAVTAHDDAPAA